MNRHVSKRVCLGLQFPAPDLTEDTEIVPLPVAKSPIRPSTPLSSAADLSPTCDDSVKLSSPEGSAKSNRIPCPYCKKLMKGERGVRKHIDFYGCPKAFGLEMLDNEND